MKKRIISTICLFITIYTCNLVAYKEEHADPYECCKHLERTISFDSSYVLDPSSNRAIAHFGLEFFQAHDFLFDVVNEKICPPNPAVRGLLYLGDMLVTSYLTDVFTVSYHEYGHFTRFYAVGLKPVLIGAPDNFFGFFLHRFSKPFTGAATGVASVGSSYTTNDDIIVSAGGVNNEMRFSSDLEDQMYYGYGHIGDWVAYNSGKFSSLTYADSNEPGNDMHSIVNGYKAKGYGITKDDIDTSNVIAYMFSGTTYAYLKGIWDYLRCGSTDVNTFEFYGFRVPDVDAYLNVQGISYKIKSGYRYNDQWLFPFAVEFISKGGSEFEVTLGARKRFPCFYNGLLAGNLIVGSGGAEGNVNGSIDFYEHFRFTLGVDVHNRSTLNGNRNIFTRSKSTDVAAELWARISFVY